MLTTLLPETSEEAETFVWLEKLGIILRNKAMPDALLVNPHGLPVKEVHPLEAEIAALDPVQLLGEIFRSHLGIPENQYLGARLIQDEQGQARLVLFFA